MFRLILAVIVLSVIFTFGLDVMAEKSGMNKKAALINLQNYIQAQDLKVKSINCNHIDNDGDGYVPCIYKVAGSDHAVECDGWRLFGHDNDDPFCQEMNEIKVLD